MTGSYYVCTTVNIKLAYWAFWNLKMLKKKFLFSFKLS